MKKVVNERYNFFIERRLELSKEIDRNNHLLKVLLRHDVHKVLLSKGFIDYKPFEERGEVVTPIDGTTYEEKHIVIHPDFNFVIDFSYVYSDHVHFQLGHKNKSNKGGPWFGEDTAKWYFLRKVSLEESIDKILEIYLK